MLSFVITFGPFIPRIALESVVVASSPIQMGVSFCVAPSCVVAEPARVLLAEPSEHLRRED
jgi:hypothetical protein